MDDRGDYNSSPCTSYRRAKNNKLSSAEYAHRAVKVNDAMNNGTQGYSPNEKIDTDKLLAHSDPNLDQISIS